jgi:hypothetical protein
MSNADNWTLVSAGPSIARITKAHLLSGPIVTVNRAASTLWEKNIPVDFAAFADGPNAAWERCGMEKLWRPPTILWVVSRPVQQLVPVDPDTVPKGQKEKIVWKGEQAHLDIPGPPLAKLWDQALPCSIGIRLMPWGIVPDVTDPTKTRHGFTTLSAFMGILRFQPRTIRILCMDMAGSWVPGKTEEECHAIDMERQKLDRWAHERHLMQRTITETRAKGIRVEEVIPEPCEESLDGAVVH